MIAGHLQEKKGFYYVVLSYKDEQNKRKTKWIATGLPIKNNKKKAELILAKKREEYTNLLNSSIQRDGKTKIDILFADYMVNWLESIKDDVEATTYSSYVYIVKKKIYPYFKDNLIKLTDLESSHIQSFYNYAKKTYGVSNNTILHYHANIRKALQIAVKNKLIKTNVADDIEKPKRQQVINEFYNEKEVKKLLNIVKGLKIEFAVKMAVYYGLRRSEILGLRWDAIDFEEKTITIKHTVTEIKDNGQVKEVEKNRTKNKGSYRVLPLLPEIETYLLELREKQRENKKIAKSSYNKDFAQYIYVDDLGNRTKPNYITQHFNILLKKHNLKMIRFHDLRHSCASILIANGISIKEIQLWLGHSDYSTTANIYVHLDSRAKNNTASAISNAISF